MKNCKFYTQVDLPAEDKVGMSLVLSHSEREQVPAHPHSPSAHGTPSQPQHVLPHRDKRHGTELRTSEVTCGEGTAQGEKMGDLSVKKVGASSRWRTLVGNQVALVPLLRNNSFYQTTSQALYREGERTI